MPKIAEQSNLLSGLTATNNLRPKVGETFSAEQVQAINNFYAFLDKEHATDAYGVINQALQKLTAFRAALAKITPTTVLSAKQRVAVTEFYRELMAIKEDNTSDPNIPEINDYTPGKLAQACTKAISVLGNVTPQFLAYERKQVAEQASLSTANQQEEANVSRHKVSKSTLLILMLQKAINLSGNYSLTQRQQTLLQELMGKEQFAMLTSRYGISTAKMNLDDVRMLIIGAMANAKANSMRSPFIQHLCHAFDINATSPTSQFELETKLSKIFLKMDAELPTSLERIRKQPPQKIVDRVFNYVRSWIPDKFKFCITERMNVNENFTSDLNLVTLTANVRNWHRGGLDGMDAQESKQLAVEQRSAAHEYLFHKLAYQNIQDGAVVPIVEVDGSVANYIAYNLIDKSGVKSMALVPVDLSKQPLDVKVLFTGTDNIAKAIIDAERYGAGHSTYRKHEAELLSKLNAVVGKLKTDAKKSGNAVPQVSITAGGHSLGGALTQNFSASMVKLQLQAVFARYGSDRAKLQQALLPAIIGQVQHEISTGNISDIKPTDTDKIKQLAEKRLDYLRKTTAKQAEKKESILKQECHRIEQNKPPIAREELTVLHANNLLDVVGMQFATLNSAGVAHKTHDTVADGLAVLHRHGKVANIVSKDRTGKTGIKYEFNKIMVGGDVVQQTGQNDVSNSLQKELALTDVVKIDAGYEGIAKGQVLYAAASMMVNFFSKSLIGFSVPYVTSAYGINEMVNAGNVLFKAHTDLHYNDPHKAVKTEYSSNQDASVSQLQQEVTKKIILSESTYYQQAKRQLSGVVQRMYNSISSVLGVAKTAENAVSAGVEKAADLIGRGNLQKAAEFAGIPGSKKIFGKEKAAPELHITPQEVAAKAAELKVNEALTPTAAPTIATAKQPIGTGEKQVAVTPEIQATPKIAQAIKVSTAHGGQTAKIATTVRQPLDVAKQTRVNHKSTTDTAMPVTKEVIVTPTKLAKKAGTTSSITAPTKRLMLNSNTAAVASGNAKVATSRTTTLGPNFAVNAVLQNKEKWTKVKREIKNSFAKDRHWQEIAPGIKNKGSMEVLMAPKTKDKEYKENNVIRIRYDATSNSTEFTAANNADKETIVKMLAEAEKMHRQIVISGSNIKLLHIAVEQAYKHNVPNVKFSSAVVGVVKENSNIAEYAEIWAKMRVLDPTLLAANLAVAGPRKT